VAESLTTTSSNLTLSFNELICESKRHRINVESANKLFDAIRNNPPQNFQTERYDKLGIHAYIGIHNDVEIDSLRVPWYDLNLVEMSRRTGNGRERIDIERKSLYHLPVVWVCNEEANKKPTCHVYIHEKKGDTLPPLFTHQPPDSQRFLVEETPNQ